MNVIRCKVTEVREEAQKVIVLKLTPQTGSIPAFKAGQFVMLRLLNPDGTLWRAKPYSICSPPEEQTYIELAFKIYGPFTQRVAQVKEGDMVEIEGPHGAFTMNEKNGHEIAFLAGGIGITPFYSMIRSAVAEKLTMKMTLLYANVTTPDIAYLDELQDLAHADPLLTVVFFVEQGALPPAPTLSEVGRVTPEALKKYCGNFANTDYYLCGPPPFMDAMVKFLTENGVAKTQIKMEKF